MLEQLEISENIYEFDLSNFFPNVDLAYNKTQMKKIGIPDHISEYLHILGKSIVTLATIDLVNESNFRKALFNSDGSINPNLKEEVKRDLKDAKPTNSAVIQKYLDQGYKVEITHGVPQGAPTSYDPSTLNLAELYARVTTVMYADAGLLFPSSNIEPQVNVPEVG